MRTRILALGALCVVLALAGAESHAGKGGNGGGKPGGGGEEPAADPAIAFIAGGFDSGSVWVMNEDGTNAHVVISVDTGPSASPCISPDGTRIVYAHDDGAGWGLWIVDVDGSNPHKIVDTGRWVIGTSWSPALSATDSDWIAYSDEVAVGQHDICVIRPDGSGFKNLTNSEDLDEADPDWNHTGTKLAFGVLESEDGDPTTIEWEYVVVAGISLDGSVGPELQNPTIVTDEGSPLFDAQSIGHLRFAHDSDRLALHARKRPYDDAGDFEIWVIDLTGSAGASPWPCLDVTADSDRKDQCPCWSPDNSRLVFRSSGVGRGARSTEICMIYPDGTDRHVLRSSKKDLNWHSFSSRYPP